MEQRAWKLAVTVVMVLCHIASLVPQGIAVAAEEYRALNSEGLTMRQTDTARWVAPAASLAVKEWNEAKEAVVQAPAPETPDLPAQPETPALTAPAAPEIADKPVLDIDNPFPGTPNPLAVWAKEQGWEYEIVNNPDGSQDGQIVKPDGTVIGGKEAWDMYYTAMDQKKWIEDLSKLNPEDAAAKIRDYVKDEATAKAVADALNKLDYRTLYTSLVIGSDKISADIAAKILAAMTPEQAADALRETSSACTASIPPHCFSAQHVSTEKSASILSIMDGPKAGAIVGAMAVTGTNGAQLAAQIVSQVSVEKAIELVNNIQGNAKVDALTAKNALLTELDKIDPVRAGELRQKCNLDPDLTKLTPDQAADYLIKLNDPTRAAAMLEKLDPATAALIIASSRMNEADAARIFRKMDADKAAAILSARYPRMFLDADFGLIEASRGLYGSIVNAQKAAEIIKRMTNTKAAAILGSEKMNAQSAGAIINNLSTEKAVRIFNKISADRAAQIFNGLQLDGYALPTGGISESKAKEILSKLAVPKAAAIIGSEKMQNNIAAELMGALDVNTAVAILGKVSPDKTAQILSCLPVSPAPTKYPLMHFRQPAITAAQAGKILEGLGAEKSAAVLASKNMSVANAGTILGELNKTKPQAVTDILAKMDATGNKVKADQIRQNIAAGSLGNMTPEQAAAYLSGLDAKTAAGMLRQFMGEYYHNVYASAAIIAVMDPAKAAAVLAELQAFDAGVLIGNNKVTVAQATKIFAKMNADKAVAILKTCDTSMHILVNVLYPNPPQGGGASSLSAQKAADIVTAMISSADNELRAIMDKIDADTAAKIISTMDPAAAKVLFRQVRPETDLPPGMTIPPQLPPFVTKAKAAAILASTNMSVDNAAKILTNFTFANDILAEMDAAGNKVKADQIRQKIGAGTVMTPQQQVTAFYQDILGRKPESQAAIDYWVSQLNKNGVAFVAQQFFASAEFQAKSTADKIAALYRVELGRAPAKGEAKSWENLYDAGTSLSDIAKYISTSKEFKARSTADQEKVLNTIKIVDAAKKDNGPTAEARAAYLYRNILGREASAKEIAARAAQIKAGVSLAALAKEFFNSPEFQNKGTADKIAALYRVMLNREPEAGGAKYWGDLYENGTSLSDIAKGISGSTEFKGMPQSFKDSVAKMDVITATKDDKGPNGNTKAWLNELGNLKPEDAAAKIAAYVKDAATAKEVADALNKLSTSKAGQIIAQGSITAQLAAQVFDQMTAQQVAGIINSCITSARLPGLYLAPLRPGLNVISFTQAAAIFVAMDNAKAAAALALLPAYTAGNILFAQDPAKTDPAVTNMKIIYLLQAMSPDSAASIINTYVDPRRWPAKFYLDRDTMNCPAAGIPARVEQIFRKMVPSQSAPIFASANMSVRNAARIINEVKKGFPDKANLILNAIDAVNPGKAKWIRTVLNVLSGQGFEPGSLIVKFNTGVTADVIEKTLLTAGATIQSTLNFGALGTAYHIRIKDSIDVVNALEYLYQTKLLEYAEPNYVRSILD